MRPIAVDHLAADSFRVRIREHELVVDQPSPVGGDAGPTPTELFVASLAACAAFFARRFLARHLADDALSVECDFQWADDHSRVSAILLRVVTEVPIPTHLHAPLQRAIEHCTVHESIARPIALRVEIAPRATVEVGAA